MYDPLAFIEELKSLFSTTVTIQLIEQLFQKEGLKPTDIRSGFSGHTYLP